MKVNGGRTNHKVKVKRLQSAETTTKENSSKVRDMVKEVSLVRMVRPTLVAGKMDYLTVRDLRPSLMDSHTREDMRKESSPGQVSSQLQQALSTKVNSPMELSTLSVSLLLLQAILTRVNSPRTRSKDAANSSLAVELSTKENSMTTCLMVKAHSREQMVMSMREISGKARAQVKVS